MSLCCNLDPAVLDDLQLRLDRAEEEFRVANLDGRIQELKDARISQVRHSNFWQNKMEGADGCGE
jgi:hypothetical protein